MTRVSVPHWAFWHYKRWQQNKLAVYKRDENLPESVTRVAISEEKIALVKNIDATTLRQHILDGKISCVEATAYYARRSFKHGRELCVLAYEHYDRAMKMAAERDEELAKAKAEGTVDQLGLFFGVPVSFKDQFSE